MAIASQRALLTIPEVAERVRVSRSTIRRRIDAGEIPAVKLGSTPQAPVRVDEQELERWITSSRVTRGVPHE
jgi:excisionase family DNA binding protein